MSHECLPCRVSFSTKNELDRHRKLQHQLSASKELSVNGHSWSQTIVKIQEGKNKDKFACRDHPQTQGFASINGYWRGVGKRVAKAGAAAICPCHQAYMTPAPSSSMIEPPPSSSSSSSSSPPNLHSVQSAAWHQDGGSLRLLLESKTGCVDPSVIDGAMGAVPRVFLLPRTRLNTSVVGLVQLSEAFTVLFRQANESDARAFGNHLLRHVSLQEDSTVIRYAKVFARACVFSMMLAHVTVTDANDDCLLGQGKLTTSSSASALHDLYNKCKVLNTNFFVGVDDDAVDDAGDDVPEDDDDDLDDQESSGEFEEPPVSVQESPVIEVAKALWEALVAEIVHSTDHYHVLVHLGYLGLLGY
jgi:hypothetical protein